VLVSLIIDLTLIHQMHAGCANWWQKPGVAGVAGCLLARHRAAGMHRRPRAHGAQLTPHCSLHLTSQPRGAARSPTSALPTTTTGLQSLPTTLQNTYVDMAHFGPYIDAAMAAANIPKVPNPLPVTLKDAMSSADS